MPEPGIPPAPPPPPTTGGMPAPGGPPAPANLPTAEPEDIFAGVKEPNVASSGATAVPPIGEQAERGGFGKKLLIIGGAIALIVIVGIVVWLVFFRGGGETVTESSTAPATTITEEAAPAPAPSDLNPEFFAPRDGEPQAPPEEGDGTAPAAPLAAPDTDGDGLTDAEEEQLGTNPQIADTDADGLSDRDETRAYRTDPLNKDTDGDSFPDGSEVQKGYNPKGSGLLFEVPPAP